MKLFNKKKIKSLLVLICVNLLLFLNTTNVYAGERSMWDMWRPVYGAGREVSRGEPSVYQSNESGIDHYTYGYGGFWSGNDYYYPKIVMYDTYSSKSYNETYHYTTDIEGRTAFSGSSVYPDAGLDPDRVYLQVSTDNSTYRTIGISQSFRVSTNSYTYNQHYIANFSNSAVGTWRYVRAKFPATNKKPAGYVNDRTATIDGFLFGIRQVDNVVPYGNAPTISNVTSDSFDVTVTGVGDSISGISTVKFPTWTTANGKDDIQWYSGTNLGNGTWKYTVNRSNHSNAWGEYTVHVYAYDADWAGNNKFLGEVKVNLKDIDAPTLTLSQNVTAWTNDPVTITASASDADSGIKNIKLPNGTLVSGSSATYRVSANGTYTFVAYDNFGNAVTKSISITNIDTTVPTLNLSISPTAWTSGSVTITASATDSQSGIKQINKPNGTVATGGSTTHVVSANGTYSFTATDNADNVATKSVTVSNIDTGNPSISIATNQNWTNASSVAVTLSSSDTQSGVASTQYSLSGATALGFTDYSAPFNIVNEGQTTITAKATDGVGHTAQTTAIVKIDRTKPSTTLTPSTTAWTSGSITITASTTDNLSGVKQIKKPDGTIINGASTTYSVSANGTYSFEITDNAGNVEVETITISNIDKTAPVVTITQTPTTWTNGNVTLSVSSTDSGAGVKEIKKPDGTVITGSSTSFVVGVDGTYTFEVTDNAGNKATKSITVSNIDKTAPEFTITPDTTVWTNGDVTLAIDATDSDAGVKEIKLPNGSVITGSSTVYVVNANGIYNFEVTDNVGNKTTKTITVDNIDKTAPGVTITPSTTAWTNENVTLSISSIDSGAGVKEIKLPNGSIVSGSTTSYTVSANGTYAFEVTDNLGNKVTKSIMISNIDREGAGITLTPNITAWTTQNIIISVSCLDSLSGVKEIRLPDGNLVSGSTASYTVTSNGVFAFEVIDNVGNKTSKSINIANIDRINPTLTLTQSTTLVTINPVIITVVGNDGQSGVKRIKLPDGNFINSENASYTVTQNGNYTFVIEDNVGNSITKSISIGNIVKIDTTSGINRIEYKLEGATIKDWTTYVAPFYISNEGITTIRARAIDNAGNVSSEAISTSKVDKTKPINGGILIKIK